MRQAGLPTLAISHRINPYEYRCKSLFGKVHTPLASRFSIRRIMATSMNVSLVCTFRS